MDTLIFIYLILCFTYSVLEFFLWMDKLCEYNVFKFDFKYLFKVYDLGVILFPPAILSIILINILIFIIELISKLNMSFLNKNLFK
jgi:hypothetical protein